LFGIKKDLYLCTEQKQKIIVMGLNVKTAKATKTAAKKEYLRVNPRGISQQEGFELIRDISSTEEEFKTLKAKLDSLKGEWNDVCTETGIFIYQETGKNPKTFMLEAISEDGEIAQSMYLFTDKYGSLTEESANELKEKFGENIIEHTEQYSIPPEMITKYAPVFEKFFNECPDFDPADREKGLLVLKETFSIAKGSVDNMANIHKRDKEGNELLEKYKVEEVYEAIKPVAYSKGAMLVKS